jgi:hypothetical protein
MCCRLIGVVSLGSVLLAAFSVIAQPPNQSDRVIAGQANLSILGKEAPVKDEGLRKVLTNDSLNCLVISQAAVPPKDGGQATMEYYVLFTNARRTTFDKRMISKVDYDALIKLADRVHRD